MDWNKAADQAQTLMQAHEALSRLMPRPDAKTQTSTAVYARVAEVDRGHFHESMFWATRELEKAGVIEAASALT